MRPSRFLPAPFQGLKPVVPAPRFFSSRPLSGSNNLDLAATRKRSATAPISDLSSTSLRQNPRAKDPPVESTSPAWSISPVNTGNPFFPDDCGPARCTPPPSRQADELLAPGSLWNTSPVNTGDVASHQFVSGFDKASGGGLKDTSTVMASDDDYAAFLDKASADRNDGATTQSKPGATKAAQHTRITTSSIPHPLQKVKATYTSDADEPFEPVSLKRSGATGSLTVKEVKELIGASTDVQEINLTEFDPHGDYRDVISAVEHAVGRQDCARVFKVGAGGARVEYWILEVAQEPNEVVGVKATSVES